MKPTLRSILASLTPLGRPSRPSAPQYPKLPLVLVVPGRFEQFWQWMHATKEVHDINRAQGSFITVDGTRYRCCTHLERMHGYDRTVPVILVGTWWDLDWIGDIRDRFDSVRTEAY